MNKTILTAACVIAAVIAGPSFAEDYGYKSFAGTIDSVIYYELLELDVKGDMTKDMCMLSSVANGPTDCLILFRAADRSFVFPKGFSIKIEPDKSPSTDK